MTVQTTAFAVDDVEYVRDAEGPLLARLFKPDGKGPFPAVVELHGGGWSSGDRMLDRNRHEALASGGIAVMALDFRQGRPGAYPAALADINFAVRWLKAHARELRTRPDLIGISGQSSGGQLAMLVAMRPHDPRYAVRKLPAGSHEVDATVGCVAMSWPVINPLSRYRHAKRTPALAELIEGHDQFWQTEAAMSEGSPTLALERGEKVLTPPALWIQTPNDPAHDYRDPESPFEGNEPQRFAAAYRKAGGEIDLAYFDAPLRFTSVQPSSPASQAAFKRLVEFFHRHLPTTT